MENSVVIVDYECMTSLGITLDETWKNLILNKSGIKKISRYDPSTELLKGVSSIEYAGEIPLSYEEIAGGRNNIERFPEPSYYAVKSVCKTLLNRIDFNIADHD